MIIVMYSMTGFGREVFQAEGTEINVEIKTVNHRYLDISFHMPTFLFAIEDQLKKRIQKHVKRGKVSVSIFVSGDDMSQKMIQTDWHLADQYIATLKQIQEKHQLSGSISIETIANLPDLFHFKEKEELDFQQEQYVLQTVEQATLNVQKMRAKEGDELLRELANRIKNIQNKVKQLGKRRKIVIIEYRERILERIYDYLADTSIYDESKLHQEVALLAEKGDITEEITRIHSHVNQFEQILLEHSLKGRKLDFIIQEINRELNTIGSKSNDPWISEQIIYLKSEAEKVKEQIQNVE